MDRALVFVLDYCLLPWHPAFITLTMQRFAGHSATAHTHMKTLQVGEYDGPSKKDEKKKKALEKDGSSAAGGGGMGMGLIMFVAVVVAIAGYFVMGKSS
jgi:hypothetical protein